VAHAFLAWLAIPIGRRWLDVGCGTGALSEAILTACDPVDVVGIDPSPGFIAYATNRIDDSRARFEDGDAMALPFDDASFDVSVSGLVLNFVPDAAVAARGMHRAVRSGGTVAAYVWDYTGRMEMMRYFWDVAGELDPVIAARDEAAIFGLCQPGPLHALFTSAGLATIEVTPIDVPTVFRDFDDYWTPFLAGGAMAPQYVVGLDDERRATLRETLRNRLPTAADGSISLTARAWAVRGTAP
jgi:SAM-dependent methyltransferase